MSGFQLIDVADRNCLQRCWHRILLACFVVPLCGDLLILDLALVVQGWSSHCVVLLRLTCSAAFLEWSCQNISTASANFVCHNQLRVVCWCSCISMWATIWLCIRFCLMRWFCDMTCLSWFCWVKPSSGILVHRNHVATNHIHATSNKFASGPRRSTSDSVAWQFEVQKSCVM